MTRIFGNNYITSKNRTLVYDFNNRFLQNKLETPLQVAMAEPKGKKFKIQVF